VLKGWAIFGIRLTAILVIIVSLVTFVMCWNYYSYLKVFRNGAEQTTGTIVDVIKEIDDDNEASFSYIFSFTDNRGQQHKITSDIGTLHKARFKVGEQIEVLYWPSMPEEARINTFDQMYTRLIVSILFGIACFVFGAYLFFKKSVFLHLKDQKESTTKSGDTILIS